MSDLERLLGEIPEPMRSALREQECLFAAEMARDYLAADEASRADILAFFQPMKGKKVSGAEHVKQLKRRAEDGTPTSSDLDEALADDMTMQAAFSPDRVYRYWLTRTWNQHASPIVIVGLNPSTADETKDDPTIRRCVGFARRWGFGGIVMLNLFAFRSTDPARLNTADDPVGPQNDTVLIEKTRDRLVLCAWGVNGILGGRDVAVARLLRGVGRPLVCLGTTKGGHPRHPLYVKGDTQRVTFSGAR